MKRRILLCDCFVSLTIFAWALLGPWNATWASPYTAAEVTSGFPRHPLQPVFSAAWFQAALYCLLFSFCSLRFLSSTLIAAERLRMVQTVTAFSAMRFMAPPDNFLSSIPPFCSFRSSRLSSTTICGDSMLLVRSAFAGGLAITIAVFVLILFASSLVIRTTDVALSPDPIA